MKNAFLNKVFQSKKQKEKNLYTAEQLQERDRKRNIVKNGLYPILLETSKNIEDAKMFCESVGWVIKSQFDNQMKTQKVSEMMLVNALSKDISKEEKERHERVLELFDQETIATALELLNQMPDAIDSFVRRENAKRSLVDLETDFL